MIYPRLVEVSVSIASPRVRRIIFFPRRCFVNNNILINTPRASQENEESNGSAVSLASIIGGVIAVAVIAAAIVIGVLCWRRRTAFRNQPNSSQSPREDVVNVDMQVPSPPNPPDSSSPNIHKTVTPDGQSYNNIYFNDFGIGNNVYESVLDHYNRPISLTRDNQGYDIPLPRLDASVDSM
ncbi:hypothetical protein PoB_000529400 [Plakobranchus ocellatus]|uniref:Uncharacterized protein n=1 Tax=Plakobranchus ocellatus TaxID=259542 RepID=A0AAV3Y9N6_9GAST|nr:hypothetical protein PoB_000529400 [Plakobranchus ocellatus]